MKKENTLRKCFLMLALLMSATLLYGGYQVHKESDKKSQYEETVRQRAAQVNFTLCKELNKGESQAVPSNPVRFLRVCAEGL
jgi:hypothetical protein